MLFFSFILSFTFAVSVVSAAKDTFKNMTPEQIVSTINSNPSLYLDPSTRSNWNLMTTEQQTNVIRTTPGSYLTSEYDIQAANSGNPITSTLNEIKATLADPFAAVGKFFTNLISSAGVAILAFFNLILGLIGQIFDKILDVTVVTQSLYDSVKAPISDAWKILRDIANIAIVFSLLYLAIKTILNGNGFAETKTLAGVLVAAILINFSLFFTTLAFNTSNFVASTIAQQIVFSGGGDVKSVSGNIQRMIGTQNAIDKLWNNSAFGAIQGVPQSELQVAFNDLRSGILAGLTIMVMAVILLVAAMMLLYRFFIFTILMITSPFGLISYFVPWFKKMGNDWWSQLKKQVIYLPVFMLTMYVALLFIGTLTSSLTPAADTVTYFYYFILTCGFLLMILILPSKVAGGGADMMSNVGNWGVSKIRALPKRSAQFAGRTAVGGTARVSQALIGNKFASALGGNTEEKRKAIQERAQGGGISGLIARQQLRTSESLKNKTYDIRNTTYGKKLGLGAGIESWGNTVESKKKVLADRKEKEEKLFGFDQQAKTQQNQADISLNEAARDAQAQVVKQKQDVLKQASILANTNATTDANGNKVVSSADAAAILKAQEELEKEKKELERNELEVGKLKNKGDLDYIKLMRRRQKYSRGRMSLTQRAAHEKLEKELEEKWKKDGKAKEKKKKGNSSSSSPTPTVRVSGSATGPGAGSSTGTSGGTGTINLNFGSGAASGSSTGTGTI